MQKESGAILDLVLDRIKKYGPPSAAVGAGLAGLTHLLSYKKQKEEAKKREDKKDVLFLDLPPSKYAGIFDTPSTSQYLLDSAVGVGTALGAGTLGYTIVDSVLKKIRKSRLEKELEKTKKEYSDLLSQKIYNKDQQKYGSALKFPVIEGIAKAIAEKVASQTDKDTKEREKGFVKQALTDPTTLSTITSIPGLGALLAGILTHNYWYNRQKDLEKGLIQEESEKIRKSPPMIRVRTVDPNQEEEEEDKEASITDGGVLDTFSTLHTIQDVLSPEKKEPVKKEKRKKTDVFSSNDIETIDDNTVVLKVDDGEVKVDAEDPQAAAMLEKYKDVIAKSIAVGANLNRDRVE